MNKNTYPITIYKASAGSGKTFTLAARYIALLLQGEKASSILAVTFTNKATAEMKQRIIENLYGIGHHLEDSDSIFEKACSYIPKEERKDKNKLRDMANRALHDIMSDYDHFTVSTIDSFLQTLLSGMAHEVGLSANYKAEINDKEIVSQAIDSLLSELKDNLSLKQRVIHFVEARITDEKNWDVRTLLKDLAEKLNDEVYLSHEKEILDSVESDGWLNSYKNEVEKNAGKNVILKMTKELDEFAKFYNETTKSSLKYACDVDSYIKNITKSINRISSKNINSTKSSKNTNIVNNELKDEDMFRVMSPRLSNNVENPSTWTKDNNSSLAENVANRLKTIRSLVPDLANLYFSKVITFRRLNELGLLGAISNKINEINKDNNSITLSRTPIKLNQSLENGDAQFILEKIGIRYSHIMIDEFQDTSRLQWNNFKPLIEEVVSRGGSALLVGDVKQSIYRWRGGDWNILANIDTEFKRYFEEEMATIETISKNYRSQYNIVNFNRLLFHESAKELDKIAVNDKQEINHIISRIYKEEETEDFCNKQTKEGIVSIKLYEQINENSKKKESSDKKLVTDEIIFKDMFDQIVELHKQGLDYSDMAILVRVRAEAEAIGAFLAQYKKERNEAKEITVVSAEAFQLNSSSSVQMIVNMLKYLNNNDPIALAYVALHYHTDTLEENIEWTTIKDYLNTPEKILPAEFFKNRFSLLSLPLYELIEKVAHLLIFKDNTNRKSLKDDAYIFTFLDKTMDFLENNVPNLETFINYWDDTLQDTNIPAAESKGIKILTIHKSKGLEYDTVLIPKCDWYIEKDRSDSLKWCKIKTQPYNKIPFVPITMSSITPRSIYKTEYENEHLQQRVDSLNALYVALTRAKNNLFVWSTFKTNNKTETPRDIGTLINSVIENVIKEANGQKSIDEYNNKYYTIGERPKIEEKTTSKGKNRMRPERTEDYATLQNFHGRFDFRQSNKSQEFIKDENEETQKEQYILQGNLLHKIYSSISTPKDTDKVITSLYEQGIIGTTKECETLKNLIERGWKNPQVSRWFNGTWNLFRECSVVCKDASGKLQKRRPDRVMINKDETIILDFKFGKPKEEHLVQVNEYINLLKDMQLNNVHGFLWYVYTGEIKQVN